MDLDLGHPPNSTKGIGEGSELKDKACATPSTHKTASETINDGKRRKHNKNKHEDAETRAGMALIPVKGKHKRSPHLQVQNGTKSSRRRERHQ
jgi:hypothetical protein